jgi:NADH dehydrogenase (ubiquinone) 1 alpha subcomplex subunit 9
MFGARSTFRQLKGKAVSLAVRHRSISPYRANFGPGGRSSNSGLTATVFGAYGFVGRYFVNELGILDFDVMIFYF